MTKKTLPRSGHKAEGTSTFIPMPIDYAVMQTLGIMGGLCSPELSLLYFGEEPKTWYPRAQSRCQYRLKLLYENGYVERIERLVRRSQGTKANIHTLAPKGARALAGYLGREIRELKWRRINKKSGDDFLEHLLDTNRVRVAFMYAVSHLPFDARIETWVDDLEIRKTHHKDRMTLKWSSGRKEEDVVLFPDSYMHVWMHHPQHGERNSNAFFEIDRGTETVQSSAEEKRTWERKIRMYVEYFDSGLYEKRYHSTRSLILTITTSEKRLANLKRATVAVGGKHRFWFTTFDQLTPFTVLTQPIWQIAYKEGVYSIL